MSEFDAFCELNDELDELAELLSIPVEVQERLAYAIRHYVAAAIHEALHPNEDY